MNFPDLPDSENQINFHFEDTSFKLSQADLLIQWLNATISAEKQSLSFLNYIFCSDNYLHDMNVKYLQHDTLTDVITFPYSETEIEGDIFISVDRIEDNAKSFNVPFETELHRVMVHGLLHLLGFGDKKEAEKVLMRKKENEYLQSLTGMILDTSL